MTGDELVQYFQTYCEHLKRCDKHPIRGLRIFMNEGKTLECTCGLDPLLAELGLPSTPDVFKEKMVLGRTDETELETMADLPPGIRKRDQCTMCGKVNPIEYFEKTSKGIIARFQCICGHAHGIVHEGRFVESFDRWIKAKRTKKKVETPEPEN